jgi:hypothetical protein
LLELLRDWWRIAHPQVWMFPGRDRINPMTTRQLNRVAASCFSASTCLEDFGGFGERAILVSLLWD